MSAGGCCSRYGHCLLSRRAPRWPSRPRRRVAVVRAVGRRNRASGPIDFGSATASLIANQSAAPESTLFRASSTIGTGVGLDGRVAFNITRALAVEGGFVWTRATLESRITSDVEGMPRRPCRRTSTHISSRRRPCGT